MSNHTKILATLKASGHRITAQRLLVLSTLANQSSHIDVDTIFQDVQQVYPYIDVTTIYRTLQWLKKLHLVTELDVGGAARYELLDPDSEPHHHMVCRECGATLDLDPHYLEEFRRMLERDYGFEPDVEHFAISGRCADCGGNTLPPQIDNS